MSKRVHPPASKDEVERRFVGGPLNGVRRLVPASQDRYYVAGIKAIDAVDLIWPPEDPSVVVTVDSARYGLYELQTNYEREKIMRWMGWDEERQYERMVTDNESPDYHG